MISGALWVLAGLMATALALVLYRLVRRVDAESCSPEWLDSFSIERFAPMERLLDTKDFNFLESQPGYNRAMGARLRRERRKAFRAYLRLLAGDFDRLVEYAKLIVVFSSEERPEFAKALWWEQTRFYVAVYWVRCRLMLDPLGLPRVDARSLVQALGGLRDDLQQFAMQRTEAV